MTMAKFSKKMMGKEVGSAVVYAPPHTMEGGKVKLGNGYDSEPCQACDVKMSVGNIARGGYSPDAKTSGIKVRGTGAATKGTMARGPMA